MQPERRRDECTAKSIEDALKATGSTAAARAMAYQNVRPDLALRVLTKPDQRRKP